MKTARIFFREFQKSKLYRILTSTGFIALILGIPTFILADFKSDRYLFKALNVRILDSKPFDVNTYYADLDSDGTQERYHFVNGQDGNSLLMVYLFGNFTKDQWNFRGQLDANGCRYFTGNYNQDKFAELACFSRDSNRILLNLVEPFGDTSHVVKDRVVDTIANSYLEMSLEIHDCLFHDLNGDNFDELVFSLSAGHAHQPRKVYAYDIRNDSILSSPDAGSSLAELLILDADRDGKEEILGVSQSSNNYPDGKISFPDTASWFMVLDDKLRYKIPPVPTGNLYSMTKPFLITKNKEGQLFLIVLGNVNRSPQCHIYEVNKNLTINQLDLFDLVNYQVSTVVIASAKKDQTLFFNQEKSELYYLDGLNLRHFGKKLPMLSEVVAIYNPQAGMPEIQYAFKSQRDLEHIVFVDGTGHSAGKLDVERSPGPYRLCWAGMTDGRYRFVLSNDAADYTVEVRKNPWQYLRFLILFGLVAGFYGFIALIRVMQSQQLARQESIKKEILELQLKSVRNQLDPHFTFNALNALSSLSMDGDHKGVDHFIRHFSRLLRTHLNTSDQVIVPLREEIEFVVNFAELQRIRFDHFFRLELDVDPDVDLNRKIPKMLIQTHVENAIKHGLRPGYEKLKSAEEALEESNAINLQGKSKSIDSLGRVYLRISQTNDTLLVIIEDNGCGRGNSRTSSFESTGTGLKAVNRIISSVKELYRMDIRQEFEDLTDASGIPCGTKVRIEISG